MASKPAKVHNSPAALAAKVELREHALADLRGRGAPVHVLDVFCGPTGEMWSHVWKDGADSYTGIDEAYVWPDPRRRFVGDNRRVLRAIDLARYNVFDVDAFGSPWEQLVIIMARRAWKLGELGAVVITDGSARTLQFGNPTHALAHLLGLSSGGRGLPPVDSTSDTLQTIALQTWLSRSGLKPLEIWKAEGRGSRQKSNQGLKLRYTAVVFECVSPGAVDAQ